MKNMKFKNFIVVLIISVFAVSFFGCTKKDLKVVKIGVTGAMYDDIWAPAIEQLKNQGIEIQLVQPYR